MIVNLLSKTGLSLERLQNFCRVAEAEGVTKAAKGDATKQSLYSRQIKELEQFFGAELMRRKGRGIVLTDAGQRLHSIAREHFASMTDFKLDCQGQPLEIAVGAGDSLIQWLIIPQLVVIEKNLPEARLKLMNLTNSEINRRLSEGLIDFGIVRAGEVNKSLGSIPLGKMVYSLFVPKDMHLGLGAGRSKKLFEDLPLAVLEGDGIFRQELAAIAKKNKLRLKIKIECSSFTLVARAVACGRAAGILPKLAADEMHGIGVVEVPSKILQGFDREICLAWNPRQLQIRPSLNRARGTFIESFSGLCNRQGPVSKNLQLK